MQHISKDHLSSEQMDTIVTLKRPFSIMTSSTAPFEPAYETSIDNPSSKSKKSKRKKIKTDQNDSDSNGTPAITYSIKEMLKPAEDNIKQKHTNKQYLLSYNNFTILLDMVKGEREITDIIFEFTEYTDGI